MRSSVLLCAPPFTGPHDRMLSFICPFVSFKLVSPKGKVIGSSNSVKIFSVERVIMGAFFGQKWARQLANAFALTLCGVVVANWRI